MCLLGTKVSAEGLADWLNALRHPGAVESLAIGAHESGVVHGSGQRSPGQEQLDPPMVITDPCIRPLQSVRHCCSKNRFHTCNSMSF